MEYKVCKIDALNEIEKGVRFDINHFNWNCVYKPKAYGYMAYLEGVGIIVRFITEEKNPKRTYLNPQDPVYKDSAVEVFVSFQEEQPNQESLYMNFEINANGAMLANFGFGRQDRKVLGQELYQQCHVKASVMENSWSVDLIIPLALIRELTGIEKLSSGDGFYCNFYKIAESKEIEHYASYSPIISEKPNFHLPEYFAKAIVK
jgi:hypothetical protein